MVAGKPAVKYLFVVILGWHLDVKTMRAREADTIESRSRRVNNAIKNESYEATRMY